MKKLTKVVALGLSFVMVFSLAACKKSEKTDADPTEGAKQEATATPAADAADPKQETTDVAADAPADRRDASTARSAANENTPLVLSTLTLDGKFSPFFHTSATDLEVYGNTQLSFITSNEKAEPVAGIDQPTVAYAFKMDVNPDQTESTYKFWIKNGVQFSDGHVLNADDVLFNLYTLFDPAYDGSSTLYSMNVQGLKAYRTQIPDENAGDAKTQEFIDNAKVKVDAAVAGNGEQEVTDKLWENVLAAITKDSKDLAKAGYTPAKLGLEGPEDFTTSNPQSIILFYAAATLGQNLVSYKDGTYTFDASTGLASDKVAGYTEEDYINALYTVVKATMTAAEYDDKFGYTTVDDTIAFFADQEKSKFLNENKGTVKNISGITKGKEVCEDGVERETITVVINGVDPKAIWNFTFPVAPMHYYAGQERHDKANGVDYFGVDFNSPEFMLEMKALNGLPMGCGPYKITDVNDSDSPADDEFFKDGICYLKANDNFILGSPKIKYLRYKTINSGQELDSVLTGEVHFSDPQASADRVNLITSDEQYKNLDYILVDNLGYGYIGLCAKLIPDINERRALMSAMDVTLTLNSYPGGLAACIYRGMSQVSWAYPEGCTAMYPFDETGKASKDFFLAAGFKEQADGTVVKADGSKASYVFTLPADAASHPAGQVFLKAQEVLAKIGVDVQIEVDTNLLNKIDQAIIPVWAAAWQATIDPDMFQVYCSDPSLNQAKSPVSFGLYEMFQNGSDEEKEICQKLNDLVIKGRTSLNVEERKPVYSEALDEAMKLAVELPTYQRKNMYVYNKSVIDPASLTPADKITPYMGPISFIWNVSLLDK